jgi:hypothetical protein
MSTAKTTAVALQQTQSYSGAAICSRRTGLAVFRFDRHYALIYIWVPIMCLQEFLNYLLPVSLRMYELFMCMYFGVVTFIGIVRKPSSDYSPISVLSLVVFAVSILVLVRDVSGENMRWFMYANMPLVGYAGVRYLKIPFSERWVRFVILCFVFTTAYGIYEYFFANYQLADIVVRSGKVTKEYAYSGMYLQKVNLSVPFYRSMSFIMEFVYFGYFGAASVFLCLSWYLYRPGLRPFLLFLISCLGTLTSLSLSVMASVCGAVALFGLLKGSTRLRILIVVAFVLAFFSYYQLILLLSDYLNLGFGYRMLMFTRGYDASAHTHMVLSWRILADAPLIGKSWHRIYEHEYIDAFMRMGIIGATAYYLAFLALFYKATRFLLRRGPLAVWATPAFLLLSAFILIGFVHHSFCATNLAALVTILFATAENSSRIKGPA